MKVFVSAPDGRAESWTHWNPDLDDWRANFYTPVEPYERKTMTVCVTGARDWKRRTDEMKARVDADMAAKGYVTFDKLPAHVQEMWAERDAKWLADSIVRHLASRSDATEGTS